MTIKICGHDVRFSRPIKFYTMLKTLIALLVINMLVVAPSFAGETQQRTSSNSSSVTAMALVMALGLRNVHGPVERVAKPVKQHSNLPLAQRQALLMSCDKGCAPARSTKASQPRMAMEK